MTELYSVCPQCSVKFGVSTSHFNRAKKMGARLFCSKLCFGLSMRLENPPSDSERKESKRLYDVKRRAEKHDQICKQKMDHYYANHERMKAEHAVYRAANMHRHVDYCRRPEYRKWKVGYDRLHLARKQYGDFAEVALLVRDLEQELDSQMSPHDRRMINGTINKAQTRRRAL